MQQEDDSLYLEAALWQESIIRNSWAWVAHIIVIFITYFVCLELFTQNPALLLCYGIVGIGCLFRSYLFTIIRRQRLPKSWVRFCYYLSVFFIGAGWSIVFIQTHEFYGHHSVQGLFAFLLIAALISGSVVANSARPMGYLSMILPITAVNIYHVATDPSTETYILSYSLLIFIGFHLHQLKISYNYLYNSIDKDISVSLERDKLRSLIDAVPGFVCFIDSDLNYRSVNNFGRVFFELSDPIGKPLLEKNEHSPFAKFVMQFMRDHRRMAISEIEFDMGEGRRSTFIVSIQKIHDSSGAVIVAVPMDELIEAREKMKAQEAQALYTSKLVSLGVMAAGIAHEINNPLGIIQGSADQIIRHIQRSKETPTEKILHSATKIQQTVERISAIIKSLSVLSRNGEKDPHLPVKLEDILEPCLEVSRQKFKHEEIQLMIEVPDPQMELIGQEIQLAQVMMNLLSNAYDAAMEGNGPKWVKLSVDETDGHIDIRIQDSGPGIPATIREKIMEPFFTTKAINKGTGLGLAISKSILEQHGGMLLLEADSPHTTFIVRMKKNLANA